MGKKFTLSEEEAITTAKSWEPFSKEEVEFAIRWVESVTDLEPVEIIKRLGDEYVEANVATRASLCESPIEEMFWEAAEKACLDWWMEPQVEVGRFRVDFGITKLKIAIEIDGHDAHKTKEQRTHDAHRERELRRLGWQVIRFTGSEVYKDARACVEEVREFINGMGLFA